MFNLEEFECDEEMIPKLLKNTEESFSEENLSKKLLYLSKTIQFILLYFSEPEKYIILEDYLQINQAF